VPDAEAWTIGRLLAWTSGYLAQHGSTSPRLDAEVLLAHVRGCPRIALYTAFDEQPDEAARAAFRELVRRRAEGMPVAYLVGRREFYSLSFRVTPDVLIPRPETEFVVVALIDRARQSGRAGDALEIADIGTGSGVLAICAAKHLPRARVTAVDISPAALAVARQNAAEHGVAERIEFLESDLFAGVPVDRRFDFIVANPPYVGTRERESLPRDVRDYEPASALFSGPEGTETIARLLPQAAERLRPGGWLLCEIGPAVAPAVKRMLEAEQRLEPHLPVKDLAGHPRVMVACRRT
jgi:release factor glutamine methyltransferase